MLGEESVEPGQRNKDKVYTSDVDFGEVFGLQDLSPCNQNMSEKGTKAIMGKTAQQLEKAINTIQSNPSPPLHSVH